VDILNDVDLDADTKILILFYIMYVILPDLLDEMPEICLDNDKAASGWLFYKLRTSESQISGPQISRDGNK